MQAPGALGIRIVGTYHGERIVQVYLEELALGHGLYLVGSTWGYISIPLLY